MAETRYIGMPFLRIFTGKGIHDTAHIVSSVFFKTLARVSKAIVLYSRLLLGEYTAGIELAIEKMIELDLLQ